MAKNDTPKPDTVAIEIPAPKQKSLQVSIMGDTPLMTHSWSQKARLEMLAKQMKISLPKEAKDPVEQFLRSLYTLDDGHYGLPAIAIKRAMVTACTDLTNVTKASAIRAFRIRGERGHTHAGFCGLQTPMDLVRVLSPNPPHMREDAVRLSGVGRVADLRYRPEFWPWAMQLDVDFNPDLIREDSLLKLLQHAGFCIGLAEFRQERGGDLGSFRIADQTERAKITKWRKAEPKEPELPDVEAWMAQFSGDGPKPNGEARDPA